MEVRNTSKNIMINLRKIFVFRCNNFFLFQSELGLLYLNITILLSLFNKLRNVQNVITISSIGKYIKFFFTKKKCQTSLTIYFENIKVEYENDFLNYVMKDIQKVDEH